MPRSVWCWLGGIALLALGALVAAAAVYLVRGVRLRSRAAERLASAACPRCASAIGAAVAAAAQLDWQERMRRAHAYAAEHRLMIRVDTRFRFSCAMCAAALSFDPSELAPELDERPKKVG